MATGRMVVSIRDIPEVLAELRVELAKMVRDVAGAEADPRVARRLREVAGMFEAGLAREDRRL